MHTRVISYTLAINNMLASDWYDPIQLIMQLE